MKKLLIALMLCAQIVSAQVNYPFYGSRKFISTSRADTLEINWDQPGTAILKSSQFVSIPTLVQQIPFSITTPSNNQLLRYNFATGKWENFTPAYLTSYTETDPIVKSINGIVKSNGTTISSATAGSDYLTPNGSAAGLTNFPTLNQNTTGTAANLSGAPPLPNGTTATTQTANDNSTKLATTAYVDNGLSGKISNYGTQTANYILAAPNGSSGAPSFRAIAINDIPTLNQNTTGSAGKWTTARNLAGNSVDGSANVNFSNKFIVQGTTDAGLSSAQFLGSLGTGIIKNTTSTGVLSIAIAGTDYLTPTGSAAGLTNFPTLNQNTTGTAANLSGAPPLPNGTTATTQVANDNSTKLATTAYVDNGLSGKISTYGAQTANYILAAPNASSGAPSFRALTLNDIPTLNQNTTGSAGKWTTARNLAGNSVDGSANVNFSNKFIVQGTTDAGLTGAQFLGSLSTGIIKNTTSTGVLSIATAGTDYLTPTGSAAGLTSFPTLNQNTTGTAANLSGTPLLPNGTTASTQAANDNSTKLATTAYVDVGLSGKEKFLDYPTTNGYVLSSTTSGTRSWVTKSDIRPYSTLTYASPTTTLDCNAGTNRTLALSGSVTLSITNAVNGMSGDIIITASNTPTLTLGSGNYLNGSVTSLASGVYHLCWKYDGTHFHFNIANYTVQ